MSSPQSDNQSGQQPQLHGVKPDQDQVNVIAKQTEATSSIESTPMAKHSETEVPHIAIIQALETQCAAWNEGDIERYMRGYAVDAIYISHSLKKVAKSIGREDDICLHGSRAIQEVFHDAMMRSQKKRGHLVYRQIQVQHATAERAFVMGRFIFSLKDEQRIIDEGVFTLDMACEYKEEGKTGQWKIVSEHSSSSKQRC